jgi:hypothetical protein
VPEICDANSLLVNPVQYSGILREGLLVPMDVTYSVLVSDISCILCCHLDTYPHDVVQGWHIQSSGQLDCQLFLHRVQVLPAAVGVMKAFIESSTPPLLNSTPTVKYLKLLLCPGLLTLVT